MVTGYGEIQECQPISIPSFALNNIDDQMYDSMKSSAGEALMYLFALSRGIPLLKAPLVASMIKSEYGLGIRPATWIANES